MQRDERGGHNAPDRTILLRSTVFRSLPREIRERVHYIVTRSRTKSERAINLRDSALAPRRQYRGGRGAAGEALW